MIGLGILLAVLGACCFAVGASLQHRGVGLVRTGDALRPSSLAALARTPCWWLGVGTSSFGGALHALALGVAPLTVVQPVGVLALGLTAIINARVSGDRLTPRAVLAITAITGGVVAFLVLAGGSVTATTVPPSAELQAAAPVALAVLLLACAATRLHGRVRALATSTAAGIAYGFSALMMRSVAQDFEAGGLGAVSLETVAGMGLALAVGGWFMQQSYAAGPPQLAVASTTVADPIVAVLIGVTLLGEAAGTSWWTGTGELVAGAIAIGGVITLAAGQIRPKNSSPAVRGSDPEAMRQPSQDLPTQRPDLVSIA